jgi:tetratricopeptide (TPR) repeat protein
MDRTDPGIMGFAAADHTDLADVYAQLGDLESASEHAERGLELRRSIGRSQGIAHALGPVGQVAELREDFEGAIAAFSEAVELLDAAGERFEATVDLVNLANALRRRGDLSGSRDALDDALQRARESGNRTDLTIVDNALGLLAVSEGRHARAVELLSQADAEIHDLGLTFYNAEETRAALDACRAELGEDAYRTAFEAGVAAAPARAE